MLCLTPARPERLWAGIKYSKSGCISREVTKSLVEHEVLDVTDVLFKQGLIWLLVDRQQVNYRG